jgi:hypothetical protein
MKNGAPTSFAVTATLALIEIGHGTGCFLGAAGSVSTPDADG